MNFWRVFDDHDGNPPNWLARLWNWLTTQPLCDECGHPVGTDPYCVSCDIFRDARRHR